MKGYLIYLWLGLSACMFIGLTSCSETESSLPANFDQIAPIDRAINVSEVPSFSWSSSLNATSYSIVISLKSDLTNPVFEQSNIQGTSITLSSPLEKGFQYYWGVTAISREGTIQAKNVGASFRVKPGAILPSPGISKYFVSVDGVDNPDRGSKNDPFRTVAYGVSQIPSGESDTLFITPGVYEEQDPIIVPLEVNLVGAGETLTRLTSSGVSMPSSIDQTDPQYKLLYDGSLIQLISPTRKIPRDINSNAIPPEDGNQVITGFSIDGQNKTLKAGLWVENRNNVSIHHLTFTNLAQRGAVVAAGNKTFYTYPSYYLTGIKIHDLHFVNSGKDLSDETLGNLNIAQLDGAQIYNVSIVDNEGYGIKFIYDGYFKNLNIYNCEISLSESDSKWAEDIAIELWNLGPGNHIANIVCNTWLSLVNHPEIFGNEGEDHVEIKGIRIIDKDGVSSKEALELGVPGAEVFNSYFENKGIGIAIWNMGRSDIFIHNNIFYNSIEKSNWADGAAVYIDNSRAWEFKNIRICNNVFDTHKVAVKSKFTGAGISGVDVKNNVFIDTRDSELDAMGSDVVFSNNLKFSKYSTSWSISGATSTSHNVEGNPIFTNQGERWQTFYKPTIGSIVIDKGVDVGLPFSGAAPDIGALEY